MEKIFGFVAAWTAMFLCLSSSAAVIDTTWTGAVSGDWNTAENWTNGLPKNTSSDIYNATLPIDANVGNGLPMVVESLHLATGSFLSVSEGGTINSALDNLGYLSLQASASLVAGSVTQEVDHVLTSGRFAMIGAAILSWQGADIHSIGEKAYLRLQDEASLTDSISGESALRNLGEINGQLELFNKSLSTSGGLHIGKSGFANVQSSDIASILSVPGDLSNFGTISCSASNFRGPEKIAAFHVNGTVTQQSGTTLTAGSWAVRADSFTRPAKATIEWVGADIRTIGKDAKISLQGLGASLKDTTTNLNALRNLERIDGRLDLDGQTMTLPDGLTIGKTGHLNVSSTYATTGSIFIAGDLVNEGGSIDISAYSNAGFPARNLVIHVGGTVGATLTGSWTIAAYRDISNTPPGPASSATIEWSDADIHTIDKNGHVTLIGAGASFRDTTSGLNALRNLSKIDGGLYLSGKSLAVSGGLVLGDGSSLTVIDSSTVLVAGNLLIGKDGSLSSAYGSVVTVAGNLSNLGRISTFINNGNDGTAIVHVNGTVAQQVGTALTGGSWDASTSSENSISTIEWAGADIHTIGENAEVSLRGQGTSLKNATSGLDALRNLSAIEGKLSLTGRSLSLSGGIVVESNASLSLSGSTLLAHGSATVNGKLVISGTDPSTIDAPLTFGSLSLYNVQFAALYDYDTDSSTVVSSRLMADGSSLLDGILRIGLDNLYGLLPDASSQYQIFGAEHLSGIFSNAADGSRIVAVKYNSSTDSYAAVGTFLIDYTDNAVTLSDFQAVPEPAIWTLLAVGLTGAVVFHRRSRKV